MSGDEQGYSGWANYETWAVALWLDNDQGSYSYWHEQAESVLREELDGNYTAEDLTERENVEELRRSATSKLADMLKDEHEEALADAWDEDARSATVFSDLLGASMERVDWYEVAGHYVKEHVDEIVHETVKAAE